MTTLPEKIRKVLPADTADTWETIAPVIPSSMYIGGGTAVAVHLQHRRSRDIDLFYHHGSVDLEWLEQQLASLAGGFKVTQNSNETLKGVFNDTKMDIIHADAGDREVKLEDTKEVAGLQVAGIQDLMAMKLKAIAQRGTHRDFFDLMEIEKQTGLTVEEGLSLFLRRNPGYRQADQVLMPIAVCFGNVPDLEKDDLVRVSVKHVNEYWRKRQRSIMGYIQRLQ